jgi:acyl-CoA thioester hydrolase
VPDGAATVENVFTYTTVPRFEDLDAVGIVNHARFFTYCEEGRIHFLRKVIPDIGTNFGMIVARTECDYVRSILFERGPVTVTVTTARVGRTSVELVHDLVQAGEPVARMVAVLVAYDYKISKSRPLIPAERDALLAHQQPVPSPA